MHTLCKRFMFDYGGEVVFDESLLPRHQDTCFITIVGNGTEQNRISFYFSSFNVGNECHAEINLIDGIADLYTRKVPGEFNYFICFACRLFCRLLSFFFKLITQEHYHIFKWFGLDLGPLSADDKSLLSHISSC